MRILFIGDIVGRPGVCFVKDAVPLLRRAEGIDVVIANAENASGGAGVTPAAYRQLREAGIDLGTLGDHIYKKQDIIAGLEQDERVCKPANYPPDAPGREFAAAVTADGTAVAVVSLLGRTYMRNVDCPFRAADRVFGLIKDTTKVVVVDMHAETTADKYLMA